MTDQQLPLTLTHWGAYRVRSNGSDIEDLIPFEADPDPSQLGKSMATDWNAKARILRPAVRKGYLEGGPGNRGKRGQEPFVEVSWDRVTELLAAETTRVSREYGNESIFGGSYGWSSAGRFHHAQSQVHRFLNCVGGYTSSVNTYSVAAGEVILPHVLGIDALSVKYESMQPTWSEIAQNAELVVAFGGMAMKNRQVGAGGPVRHLVSTGIDELSAAGVKFVNVSFTRDDAPPIANLVNVEIRPCTDTALMLGLAHTLVAEGLWDEDFVTRCAVGIERFLPYLTGAVDGCVKDADWASRICGVPSEEIQRLAREMANSRTLVTVAMSLQRQEHGEQSWWMAIVLAAMLGQMGLPGRGIGFGYGSLSPVGNSADVTRWPYLNQGRNPVDTYIPVARVTDMLLNPGAAYDYNGKRLTFPDIKMIWWAGGNPFHHHQDLNKLVQAWQRPDTVVVHEVFWNAHARHADIVLPATTSLERNDLGCAHLDPHLIAMKKVAEPQGESRSDYDILTGVAEAMGKKAEFTLGRDEEGWLRYLYGQLVETVEADNQTLPTFDQFWDAGWIEVPFGRSKERPRLAADLRRDPAANPIGTPSGRIEIFSSTIESFGYADCPPHPTWLEPREWHGAKIAETYPLYLSSNQPSTRLHSQYDHGSVSRKSKVQGREPVRIHPDDAAARQIAPGSIVRIFNGRGSCLAAAQHDAGIQKGVLQLPTGAWFYPVTLPDGSTIDSHGNPNVLTQDQGTSQLAQGPSVNAMVDVEAWTAPLPELAPYLPPTLDQDEPEHRGER